VTEFPLSVRPVSYLALSLQQIVQQIAAETHSEASPVLVHMLGIPGAGKTTFINELSRCWEDRAPVLVGFDQIMESMPEYRDAEDKEAAFAAYELPAREAGYRLIHDLLQSRASILFDNGGSASCHLDLLRFAKENGYRVAVVSILSSPGAARERLLQRFADEGRYTPHEYLEDRAEKIAHLQESYKSLTPYFYEIDNDVGVDRALFLENVAQTAEKLLSHLNPAEKSAKVGT
jgi:predicted ABC-type ATPase